MIYIYFSCQIVIYIHRIYKRICAANQMNNFLLPLRDIFFVLKLKKKQNFTEGYDFNLFHIKQHILT